MALIKTKIRKNAIEVANRPEVKKKNSEWHSKIWKVKKIYDNNWMKIKNLYKFCNDNNLNYHCMVNISNNTQKFHKKEWLCKRD